MEFSESAAVVKSAARTILILAATIPAPARATLWPSLRQAQSLFGPTGYARVYSSEVLEYRHYSIGVHKFGVGLSFGWPRRVETGVWTDLNEITPLTPVSRKLWERRAAALNFHAKIALATQAELPVAVAAGARRDLAYIVAGRDFPIRAKSEVLHILPEAGVRVRRERGENSAASQFSLAFQFSRAKWSEFFVEREGITDAFSAGWRFLIGKGVAASLLLEDVGRLSNVLFDNFFFGVTLTGR